MKRTHSVTLGTAFLLFVATLANPPCASAEENGRYSFPELWKRVRQHSPEMQAARHELDAASLGESRASRHWYPRLYTDFRVFGTNDPAMSFMSLLGQRQIRASDFDPNSLNHPGGQLFEKGTLGLELALYEGGARTAQANAARKLKESRNWELKSAQLAQYAELAGQYASLLIFSEENLQLRQLLNDVRETISNYRIGSKANPVGYSGLLGMKNLKNRLEALLTQIRSQQQSIRNQVGITAQGLPEKWEIQPETTKAFLHRVLPLQSSEEAHPVSVRAAQSGADALEETREIETARLLPRVGLFAEGNLYGGSRAASTSYVSGAFLQWDLFSAPNFGAARQAAETAAAARSRAEALSQRSRIERSNGTESVRALSSNLELMDDSAKLLREQTATARTLFRNGSINALQLVEVLNRRVDLIVSRAEIEAALVQAYSTLALNSSSESLTEEISK